MKMTLRACLLVLLCAIGACAQAVAGNGAITGTVTEGLSDDGLPGAAVVLSNPSLGFQRTYHVTDDGTFDFPNVVPGTYTIKITRSNFTAREITGIQVAGGQTLNLVIPLQSERVSRKLPEYHQPLLEDHKNVVSRGVTPLELASLPSANRTLGPYVLLTPGTALDNTTGDIAFRGEAFTNTILTDGNYTTNNFYLREPADRSQVAPQVSLAAIDDVSTASAGWQANLGRTMSGVVNLVSRSGGNAIHGEAYGYLAASGWTVADKYAPGFNPGGKMEQPGISVGGPIWPGKVFGFVNFEALNTNSQGLTLVDNPLLGNSSGTAILASNCKAPASTAQCNAAIAFLNPQIGVTAPHSLKSRSGLAKFDWRPNQANSVTIEGNAMHRDAPGGIVNAALSPNGGLGNNGTYGQETRYAKAGYTRTVTDHTINQFRASWFNDRFSEFEDTKLLPSTGLLNINIAGTPFGGSASLPSNLSERHYQIADNFTFTGASSTLNLGFDGTADQDHFYQPLNFHGVYDYASLSQFAQDFSGNTRVLKNYMDFQQGFGTATTNLRPQTLSAYAVEEWKASVHLTVFAGVRWERTKVPQPTTSNPIYYQTQTIGAPKTDFSPRLGLAYRLGGKTVIRVGGGTYYQPFPGELMRLLTAWNNVYQQNIMVTPLVTGSPVFPAIFSPSAKLPALTPEVAFAVAKFRQPYALNASLEVEHQLTRSTTFTIGGVWDKGVKLWTLEDQAEFGTTTTSKSYAIDNAAGAQTGTYTTDIFTNKGTYAHAWQIENEGASRYYGATLQIGQRFWHGVTAHASYTWSRTIDDVSGPPQVAFVPSNYIPGNFRNDQGSSLLDQRHRAVISVVWQPRVVKDNSVPARFLLNGWQLSSIATIASGLPETPLAIPLGQQFSGTNMAFLNSLNGSGGWDRAPFASVNSLRLPAEYNVDARITRTLPFTERIHGALLFEAFNAFNKQWATSMNTIGYTATSGVIHPVAGVGTPTSAYGPVYGTNGRRLQVGFKVTF